MALIDWALLKANPDAERNQLNKILKEARENVDTLQQDVSNAVVSVVGTHMEIDIDNTDPQNPVASLATEVTTNLTLASTALQPADLADTDDLPEGVSNLYFTAARAEEAIFLATDTAATTGAASGLPANPAGYVLVMIEGNLRKIPYYNE